MRADLGAPRHPLEQIVSDPTVRPVDKAEFGEFLSVVRTAFLGAPLSDDAVDARRARVDLERSLAAFDGSGRMCGVAGAFTTPLTVPGGELATGAVTGVGVLPTHTRQGHLRRLMDRHLDDMRDRGEAASALIAAEYPIYGRFGYGPATESATLRVDATTAAWLAPPVGSVEIVAGEVWAEQAADLYDAARRRTPGHIGWNAHSWRADAGVLTMHDGGDERRAAATKVIWRDATGTPGGVAAYRADEAWSRNRPANTLDVTALVGASPVATRELVRYLCDIDWVSAVVVPQRPVDDPTPLQLVNGRSAQLEERWDFTWLRLLDVPAALTTRRYAAPGRLVVEVVDAQGYATGTYALDAGTDGAACAATTRAPDLTAPVGALSAAYLGGQSWARLAAAGWVDEHRPGTLATADALFAVPRAPWGAVIF